MVRGLSGLRWMTPFPAGRRSGLIGRGIIRGLGQFLREKINPGHSFKFTIDIAKQGAAKMTDDTQAPPKNTAVPKMLIRNKTFSDGPDFAQNACVGDNSGIENKNGYAWGFSQAVEVMAAAVLNGGYIDCETGEKKYASVDGLVYPLCFCARHHMELFLKREVAFISRIRGKKEIILDGHDLAKLRDTFENLCKCTDRQLSQFAAPMKEYVMDYAQVDSTGQVFRYAEDKANLEHLNQVGGIINLEVLVRRFFEFNKLVNEFEVYREYIMSEFATGTFTSKLSRNELWELADMLPPYETWATSESFDIVRQSFRNKYDLSSNDFSRAIDVIKKHREFSLLMGVELPLKEITEDVLIRLRSIDPCAVNGATLTKEEWLAVQTTVEIARNGIFSEEYDYYLYINLNENSMPVSPPYIFSYVPKQVGLFRKGLTKMGQESLVKKFDELFPAIPVEEVDITKINIFPKFNRKS